jgi:FixJ family two-component response regulator
MDGLTCLTTISQRYPSVRVVMLSAVADAGEIRSVLERGATAYIVKSIEWQDLAAATTVSGAVFCPDGGGRPAGAGATAAADTGLTDRQTEILRAVARGLTNRTVAEEFWLSDQTVKFPPPQHLPRTRCEQSHRGRQLRPLVRACRAAELTFQLRIQGEVERHLCLPGSLASRSYRANAERASFIAQIEARNAYIQPGRTSNKSTTVVRTLEAGSIRCVPSAVPR